MYPTKHFVYFSASTLLAPYLHQFSAMMQIMHFLCYLRQICIIFFANLASKSNFAIWDEFSEQHQHQSIKISTITHARLACRMKKNWFEMLASYFSDVQIYLLYFFLYTLHFKDYAFYQFINVQMSAPFYGEETFSFMSIIIHTVQILKLHYE